MLFPLQQEKIRPPRYLAQLSIWMIGLGILDVLKLCKTKMDSNVIISHQCSLEKSHAVSIEPNFEL